MLDALVHLERAFAYIDECLLKLIYFPYSLSCLGLAVAECGMIAKQFAQIVEFFLRPEQKASKARITQLCTSEDKSDSSDDELLGFALEGLRLANCMPVIPRLATDPAIVASGTDVNFSKGDGVIVSLKQAGLASSPLL